MSRDREAPRDQKPLTSDLAKRNGGCSGVLLKAQQMFKQPDKLSGCLVIKGNLFTF